MSLTAGQRRAADLWRDTEQHMTVSDGLQHFSARLAHISLNVCAMCHRCVLPCDDYTKILQLVAAFNPAGGGPTTHLPPGAPGGRWLGGGA